MSSEGFSYLIKIDTNGNVVLPQLAANADKANISLRRIGKDSDKSMAGLNNTAKQSSASLKPLENTARKAEASIRSLGNISEKSLQKLKSHQANNAFTPLAANAKKATESIKQLRNTANKKLRVNADVVYNPQKEISFAPKVKNPNGIFKPLIQDAKQAEKALRNLSYTGNKSLSQLNKQASKSKGTLRPLSSEAKAASSHINKIGNSSNRSFSTLYRAGQKAKGLLGSIRTGSQKVITKIRQIGSTSDKSFKRLERNANHSRTALSRLRGMAAGLGLTLTTGAAMAGLVGTGAGFEKSMSNVQALSNATKTEMVSLTKAARDAGAKTAYTARESADAMGYLALAGYNAEQQISALPATLNLAAAGSIDLARSADIATNILSQYRMKAKDTGVVVDQLAFTQSRFNTNIEEAADAMNYWGPTAAAMKIKLSESNATIGLLANNGLKGSLATRALGTSIVRLSKPTTQMRQIMDELNLSFFDSEGRFVGMAGMVDILNQRMGNLTDQQKQAALSTVFGSEAIQEMNILLAEGAGKIRYWTNELENAEGTAKRMSDTKLDNLAGDFQILKSSSQEVSLQIFEELSPALRAVTKEATLFIRNMDTKKVSLMLKKTVLQLRSGVIWLGQHKRTIINLGKALVVLKAVTLSYNAGIKLQAGLTTIATARKWAYAAATKNAAVANRALNMAIKANPLGLMLSTLTAVIGAVTLFRDRTKEAASAQRDMTLAGIESQILKEESKGLVADTKLDTEKVNLNSTSQRQLVQIKESAIERKNKAEDVISDLKAKAKSSPEYKEYARLAKKEKQTKIENGLYKPGLSIQETIRKKGLEEKINKMPETQTGLTLTQLQKVINDNTGLIKKVSGLIKPDEDTNSLTKPVSNQIDDSNMSENIISGGASQKVVNVSLEKFQDNVNFNIYGQIEELRDSMDEMRQMFNENLMRILNSANQLAN
jgi:TP901 family phage tail tape measure protein